MMSRQEGLLKPKVSFKSTSSVSNYNWLSYENILNSDLHFDGSPLHIDEDLLIPEPTKN